MTESQEKIAEMEGYIAALGLSRKDISRLLNVNERTVYRWLSGERPMDLTALLCLKLLAARGLDRLVTLSR